MTFSKAYRLIPFTVTQDNNATPTPLMFYYCSRNTQPSTCKARQHSLDTGVPYFHKGHFLSYPWTCTILQKGRHKDTPLDKLIVVLAIIYTHLNVFFFPFPGIPIQSFLHYLCCYLVVQQNIWCYNLHPPSFSFKSLDVITAKTQRKCLFFTRIH